MRHPHGLRASAGKEPIVLPAIGAAFQGGFYAGSISHTANSVATHALIVAPAASGYNGQVTLQWKTSRTNTAGTTSLFDGAINSANMNDASHPAAQYCEGLTIDGYSDWYLPAFYELAIAYVNLKPTTTINVTYLGTNAYEVPARTVNYTTGNPARTSVATFQSGGAQAFVAGIHWASSQLSSTRGQTHLFNNGDSGAPFLDFKDDLNYVRAFRKVAL